MRGSHLTASSLGMEEPLGGVKTRLGWYLGITISEMYPGARGQ